MVGFLKSNGDRRRLGGRQSETDRPFDGRVGDEEIREALHGAIDRFFDRLSGKSKQQRAAAALDGSTVSTGDAAPGTLPGMMRALGDVDDLAWGRYILDTDMLRDKIKEDEADVLIAGAQECGREWADRVVRQYGSRDPIEIAAQLGVSVGSNTAPMSGRRALFAQYVPGNADNSSYAGRIEVMSDPLNRYGILRNQLVEGDPSVDDLLPTPVYIRTLLLAHELFHALEDRNESSIYTRTTTISLWKICGKENRSTVRSLGEIGAGAFAQALIGSSFCPFALDILMMWAYDSATSQAIYDAVRQH